MPFLLEILSLTAIYAVISHYARRRLWSSPPGPLGVPLLGNLLDLPTHEQWRRVVKWGKKYGDLSIFFTRANKLTVALFPGDVIYLRVLGTPLVYLNSAEAAADLLDARGGIYSDRPNLTMASEMYCKVVLMFR